MTEIGRANRFSRTPSALAGFIGATRATASQGEKCLNRAPVSLEETELLCTSFERTRDRPKIEEHLDRARVASQG